MPNVLLVAATVAALWLCGPAAQALGFGRIANTTQLGQPLNFTATIRLGGAETLARECVGAEVHSGENRLAAAQIRVTLEPGGEPDERSVRVTSSALIDEPVVTVEVTIGCEATLSRKFVAFIDPPAIGLAQSADAGPAESRPVPARRNDAQTAALAALVEGNAAAAAPPVRAARAAPRRPAPSAGAPGRADRPVPRAQAVAEARRAPSRPITRVALTSGGARLQLEKAQPPPAPAPLLAAVPAASAASAPAAAIGVVAPVAVATVAAAGPDPQAEATRRDLRRIEELERGLAQMQREAQTSRQAVTLLQARLQQAESERGSRQRDADSPLVYALAGLVGLLALAVAGLWWRQARSRDAASWWAPATAGSVDAAGKLPETAPAAVTATGPDLPSAAPPETPMPPAPPSRQPSAADAAALPALLVTATAAAPEPAPAEPVGVTLAAPRTVSVEELIDLQQQAEFFVVLGQDEAAIDRLSEHVGASSDAGASPMPYLQLLEIHRRRGDLESYESVRRLFALRFGDAAPDWNADLQLGQSLEERPEVIARLQGLWLMPSRAMQLLSESLFRRTPADARFDLPAYRDLMLLFSVARDLSEQSGAPAAAADGAALVDLLLPLDLPGQGGTAANWSLTTSALRLERDELATLPLDLDVSLATQAQQERQAAAAAAAVRQTRPEPHVFEFSESFSRPGGAVSSP